MHRDIVIKMPANYNISDTQNIQTKMTDSKGKKNSNNKICVYSQKYVPNTVNTQQLEEEQTSRVIIPSSKVKPQLQSITSQSTSTQGDSKSIKTEQKQWRTINSYEIKKIKDQPFRLNERTIQAISQKIASVQTVYESKIRKIIQDNAKMINELRVLLTENQKKLAQKDSIIQRLILVNSNRQIVSSVQKVQKLPNNTSNISQFSFLQNKIKDLQNILRVIIQNLASQQQNTAIKLQQIQKSLLKHHFMRIASCSYRLQNYIHMIDQKLVYLQQGISTHNKQNNYISTPNNEFSVADFKQIKSKIQQLSHQIQNFKTKQFKYENQAVQRLQNILITLLQRVDQIQILRGTHKLGNSAVFDQDEFFYPPSIGKIYQTNDQYEHFQSQSEQQSTDLPHLGSPQQKKSPNKYRLQSPKVSYD